jgi:hypothetical protein
MMFSEEFFFIIFLPWIFYHSLSFFVFPFKEVSFKLGMTGIEKFKNYFFFLGLDWKIQNREDIQSLFSPYFIYMI